MNNRNISSGELKEGTAPAESGCLSSHETVGLKNQMPGMQMETDILKETVNVLKKDPGTGQTAPRQQGEGSDNRCPKDQVPAAMVIGETGFIKKRYYYQEQAMSQPDRYFALRIRIRKLFTENKNRYGCRRIHALLRREDAIVSEKTVRRIMNEENPAVKVKRTAEYNSYAGEAAPSVPNEIKRDFSGEKPDSKWLTDITESAIPAGKVCKKGSGKRAGQGTTIRIMGWRDTGP